MANIKVSEMTTATSFENEDYTMIVQGNKNKKITRQNILGNIENDISTIQTNIGNKNNLTTQDKTNLVSAINEVNGKFGKLLWSGSFTSGTITVPDLTNYKIIICNVGGAMCIGDANYGLGGVGIYGQYASQIYNYRFSVDENTLTIDNLNRGGSNGTINVAVTEIYGLF